MSEKVALTPKQPWIVFFDEVEIPAKQTVFIRHRRDDEWDMVALFRGQKLITWESAPGATGIAFAFVGTKMQMALPKTIAGVPSSVFSEGSPLCDVLFDTCEGKLDMTLVVTNNSDEPVKFKARLDGQAVLKQMSA